MNLKTLLKTADLGLDLLVGADAVDRPITRVFTATLRDPRRFLTGGELVLSGMEWWQAPEDSEAFVAGLAEAGVTALGAGTAESGGVLPEHVVEACKRHNVPLLVVPVHIPFATISERVILGLAAERSTPNLDRHRRLVAVVTAGGGLDALVKAGETELGAECWVLSAAGRVIAGKGESSEKLTKRFLHAERLPIVTGGLSVFATTAKERALGWFLVVAGDYRTWERERQDVASEFATLIGLERSRIDEARRIENRAAKPLLRLLLSEQTTQNDIQSQLAATELDDTEVVTVSSTKHSAAVVDDLLSAFDGPALVGTVDDEAFGLLGTNQPITAELKAMVRTMEPALGPTGLVLGLGRSTDATGLRTAILQARYARKLAERSPGRVTVMAGDEVASHLLLLAAVPDELRRSFRNQILGPLSTYDATHKSELTRTLRVFLEHSGSWTLAAAELHVHVNTLRYRITRITELTGRDPNRFGDRVDLYLALANETE
ncbi:helix-turn-helix domain-containing protein [Kibdelosporangium philippinense]|uniref:Helix-turn-helix domain-containing protein n=1 Tax=Kibdelosporangium philippinense TaxID=211113 RepID=A0ABS8Z4Y8_9PSEU|nr:PucR family transcriptional regulator [Kibdelosporangium philippinense]MCE7002989.1 helix-turn-helix domain-containing protein [Kibdelosporangium philippinense]